MMRFISIFHIEEMNIQIQNRELAGIADLGKESCKFTSSIHSRLIIGKSNQSLLSGFKIIILLQIQSHRL